MCGLYSFKSSPEEVRGFFNYTDQPNFPPRAHVAPTQPIAIVRRDGPERRFALVRWGLVPSWTKELKSSRPLINARSETVAEKPSFRSAFKRRRCLIPADGFYEWTGEPGKKQPWHIHRPDGAVFAFAGIWEHWVAADGSELESAAIITTEANDTLQPIHHRMPVVIEQASFDRWMANDETDTAATHGLMRPAANDYFVAEKTIIDRPRKAAAKPAKEPAPAKPDQLKLL